MKPVVMYALSKELQGYIKSVQRLDRSSLLEINKRLLKMQLEVSEIMEKITKKIFAFSRRIVRLFSAQNSPFVRKRP